MAHTLKTAFSRSGVGLHSGKITTVTVLPSHNGRQLLRTDLPASPPIEAILTSVVQTNLSTELGQGEAKVRTVEHLLAALVAMGVDHARIEVDGPEIPLLDGSAQSWVEAIAAAGLVTTDPEIAHHQSLTEAVWVQDGDAFVAALPAVATRFSYGIDFPTLAIGQQWYSWQPQQESFAEAIAPARTFVMASQVEALKKAGLIQGGSLENALVCDEKNWLNPPLRFTNEPVRHKLLDLVGDLSLLGTIPVAHYLAYKASHRLHIQLAQTLQKELSRL